MAQQPEWKTIYATDYSKLQVDATGVYPAELTIIRGEEAPIEMYRIVLDPCTYTAGILSDNKYHPEHPAWFAEDLPAVARSIGSTWAELVTALCSSAPTQRAWAYEAIASYHGEDNFGEPDIITEEEANAIL